MMKNDRQKIIMILLIILLVFAGAYIAIDKYKTRQLQNQILVYKQGLQAGYEQAIIQLFQQAMTCQQVPIWAPVQVENQTVNKTINLIAVECLQQK